MKNKQSQWTLANKLSAIGVVVNFILLFGTLLLYTQAVNQNHIAENNYKLAKDVFDSSVQANISNAEQTRQSLNLQSKSINAQIAAINETQNEFAIANKPFLGILDIERNLFTQQERIVSFKIINSGRYPVKIIGTQFVSAYGDNSYKDSIKHIKRHFDIVNDILSSSTTYFPVTGKDNVHLGDGLFNNLISGKQNYYIGYYIQFKNLINNKEYLQLIIIKMATVGDVNIRIEENSITEI